MKKQKCPFCFVEFDERNLIYECSDCRVQITAKEAKYGGKCKTPTCNQRLYIKKCPICIETLPESLFKNKILPFSLIGDSYAGATTYLTIALNELIANTKNLKLSISAQNSETRDSYKENRRIVYSDRMFLPATPPMSARPSIWMAKNHKRRVMWNPSSYVLSIFDGAGEIHSNLHSESAQRDARYIEHSKGIIFVIDPLRFSGLRSLANCIDPKNYKNSSAFFMESNNSVTIIHNTAKLIRRALNLRADAIIDMSVAVVITKMDLFLDDGFSGTKFSQQTPHSNLGYFDMQDCLAVDKELTDWLIDNGEQEFVFALEQNFRFNKKGTHKKKCFLFGVSALGNAPTKGTNGYLILPEIRPHRVLDPILWLLAQQNFIDTKLRR